MLGEDASVSQPRAKGIGASKMSGGSAFRLLHLIYSAQRRGAETFALQLATSLSGAPITHAFCSVYGTRDELGVDGFPVLALDASRAGIAKALRFDPAALQRLVSLLRGYRPDIIVAHGADTLKYAALARLVSRRGYLVYRNIGIASHWAGSRLKTRLNGVLVRRFDRVISVGEVARQDFDRTYGLPGFKTVAIPNGVDVEPFTQLELPLVRQRVRAELGLTQDEHVAIAVGSLTVEKNPTELLKVVASLATRGMGCRLLLVGDGPLRETLAKEASSLGIGGRVVLLGPRSDVSSLMAAADLLLLASRTEGMPAALIEAGLAGLPVVAHNVGGVSEIVEKDITGFLVEPGDRESFQNAVMALLQSPQRRAIMGTLARQRYLHKFDIRTVARQYEQVFRDLLGAGDVVLLAAGNCQEVQQHNVRS